MVLPVRTRLRNLFFFFYTLLVSSHFIFSCLFLSGSRFVRTDGSTSGVPSIILRTKHEWNDRDSWSWPIAWPCFSEPHLTRLPFLGDIDSYLQTSIEASELFKDLSSGRNVCAKKSRIRRMIFHWICDVDIDIHINCMYTEMLWIAEWTRSTRCYCSVCGQNSSGLLQDNW